MSENKVLHWIKKEKNEKEGNARMTEAEKAVLQILDKIEREQIKIIELFKDLKKQLREEKKDGEERAEIH